jgi:hypothetical protein
MLARPYLLSVLFASLLGLAGVAGATPVVVSGVELTLVSLVSTSAKPPIASATRIVIVPNTHVVGLIMRSGLAGAGGIGRLFGLELSYVIGNLPYAHQRVMFPIVPLTAAA